MSKVSHYTLLGLIFHDENKTEGAIAILQTLIEWVDKFIALAASGLPPG